MARFGSKPYPAMPTPREKVMSERLNPLTLPLQGSRLIEASAGTGKTWTIAALYLRLVLGHGGAAGPARALLPGEILVMTFTKAATRELSDRIRQRLVEAAACFRGERAPKPDDGFLVDLLADFPAGEARQQASWRLAMAAEAMDDAAVHTIDAWCQRMLREHAFDSGCLFDEELQANGGAMLAEAARDYWRQQVYPLASPELAVALTIWKDVEALVGSAKSLLEMPLPPDAGQGSLGERIAAASGLRAQALADLKRGWAERATEMQAWLDGQMERKDCPFNKVKLKPAHYTAWIVQLSVWASDPDSDEIGLTDTAQKRLTAVGLNEAVKPGAQIDIPACFPAFEALMAALPRLPEIGPSLRSHAAVRIAQRLQQAKAQAGTFGFADMLNRLNAALDPVTSGDRAQRLRQRILDQYPVALVDEFQDTSPVQLCIFDRLYRIADNAPGQALLLIGDPKQSIYGFRGADIYSYLGARRATQGRHHVLGTNHRSTRALVDAVNGLFNGAEARAGEGAFMFRPADTLAGAASGDYAGLPFQVVAAKGRDERFVASGGDVPAVTLCLDAELRSKGDSRELCAALCAERIVTLLNDAEAGFAREGQPIQRLRPADIAVLVRTGTEAAAVRAALRRRGVASVYLSDKDTVFKSDEAQDLLRLLQAAAAPRDVRLARAALATALVGHPLEELLALSTDDERFDVQCELLAQLHVTWQAQGILAMVRRALHGFGMPARWLATDDGERRLTNVLHLAELLQAASTLLDGEQALVRWMAQQIDDAAAGLGAGTGEEQVLRLESDADLVKVVTVHKSKGLEYPLVFLPFAAHFRPVERKNTAAVLLPDAHGVRQLFLAPSDAQIAAADKERHREDLRLLYVALTRARHSLWVGVSALKVGRSLACVWHQSGLGYLVSGPEPKTPEQLGDDLRVLAAALPDMALSTPGLTAEAPTPPLTRLRPRGAPPPLLPAPPYAAEFDRMWAISSYSALVKDAARSAPAASGDLPVRVLRDDEPLEASGDAEPVRANSQPWHRFPRGAFAGNFLHDQLEWLAGEGFALEDSASLQKTLRRRCERQGWGHRADDVVAWLARVCATPMPALGCRLADLGCALPEMEFWLPSDGLRARAVDELSCARVFSGFPRPSLPERALRGMLMGFADLMFEHGDRYGVLDYKSNALGARDADYTLVAMEAAMLEHRYDVQAALYLLALHRLLKTRLGAAYAPAAHLHGAVYLFLRGVSSERAGCFHLPAPLALIDALDAMLTPTTSILAGAAA
jgi:exodeoxyribonuclease V beta subunit